MPINIYNETSNEKVDWLCDNSWNIAEQIDALESWLKEHGHKLTKANYVADIGFDIRKEATGGGAVLSAESMKIMGEIGMDVYLSEYPGQLNEE